MARLQQVEGLTAGKLMHVLEKELRGSQARHAYREDSVL
ncbi:uncharacterized protein CTRU02_201561 [Colletotrichum truncatum]|uniref:Uncharacterized protein n=1 Tax=Colletotrichum truncatum TaxID=5467 RepID=A0ACC3ZHW5_COLTU